MNFLLFLKIITVIYIYGNFLLSYLKYILYFCCALRPKRFITMLSGRVSRHSDIFINFTSTALVNLYTYIYIHIDNHHAVYPEIGLLLLYNTKGALRYLRFVTFSSPSVPSFISMRNGNVLSSFRVKYIE